MMADHLHGLSLSLRDDCRLRAVGALALRSRSLLARSCGSSIRAWTYGRAWPATWPCAFGVSWTPTVQAEDLCEAYRPEGEPPPPDDDAITFRPAWREYFDLVDNGLGVRATP